MTSASSPVGGHDLRFDLADRMRKTLRISGVTVGDMAEYLGVSRNTVGNWINGHIKPSIQTQRLWAIRTGVPFTWLQTGEEPGAGPDGEGVRHQGLEPRTRWFGDSSRPVWLTVMHTPEWTVVEEHLAASAAGEEHLVSSAAHAA